MLLLKLLNTLPNDEAGDGDLAADGDLSAATAPPLSNLVDPGPEVASTLMEPHPEVAGVQESLNASAAQLLMEVRSLAAQLGSHANRTTEALVQILNYDDTEHFSSHVRGMYEGLDKEHIIIIKVFGSLFLFFVIVLGLLRPLLRDIFFAKQRLEEVEEEKEEEGGLVPVKSLFSDDDFSTMVKSHQSPSTPTRISKSQGDDEVDGELAALRRIHKKALNLHSLLGMTFKHLEHCEGDLNEVMDQLTLAEASVASSCVSLLDEIETEMGGVTLPRSPVQLPKPGGSNSR